MTDRAIDIASSAAPAHLVTAARACTRHPEHEATGACEACDAPLCRACTIHAAHRRCGGCRLARGAAPVELDGAWRVSLVCEGVAATFRALPERTPAVAAVAAMSLALAVLGTPVAPTFEEHALRSYGWLAWLFAVVTLPLLAMPRATPRRRLKGALVSTALWVAGGGFIALVVNAMKTNAEAWRAMLALAMVFAYVPWLLCVQALVVDGVPSRHALRDAARMPVGAMAMHAALAAVVALALVLVASALGIAGAIVTTIASGNVHDDAVVPFASTFAVTVVATLWFVAESQATRAAPRASHKTYGAHTTHDAHTTHEARTTPDARTMHDAHTAHGAPTSSRVAPMHALRLGPLTLDVPAIQGALSGYSDLPMRRVARAFGCVYAMNEVVLDELVVLPGKLRDQILRVADDDHPVGGQILGATPETFAAAAALLVDAGYDVVDINFGCPVKKTVGRCRGGFLLSEPDTALEIVARVRDAVRPDVPVTVKMRRGIDDDAESVDKFWRILDGAFARGVAAVCVHARTVAQRYVGPARRSFLSDVKRAHPTRTILGSGDVFHARDVVELLKLDGHGVDGAWIGRGAIGAPWIFAEVEHLLRTGRERAPPSFTEQRRAVWMHHREALALYGRELGNRFFRSAAMKYAEAHPQADVVKATLYAARRSDDVEAVLAAHWDESYAEDHFGPVLPKVGPGHLVAAGARLSSPAAQR